MDTNDIRNILIAKKLAGGGSGGSSQLDSLIDRSIAGVIESNVKTIGHSAFRNCVNITEATFPEATTISASAFHGCSN